MVRPCSDFRDSPRSVCEEERQRLEASKNIWINRCKDNNTLEVAVS